MKYIIELRLFKPRLCEPVNVELQICELIIQINFCYPYLLSLIIQINK